MTGLDHHPRWREAVARNRARFDRGSVAERARVRDELDELAAELRGRAYVPEDATARTSVGVRFVSQRALLLAHGPLPASD